MSINAVADYMKLDWRVVKNIHKASLQKKYQKPVCLKKVRAISIDEIYIGRKSGFITIVRCAHTGRVLHIAAGKGGAALEDFGARLKRRQNNRLDFIVMDMSSGYSCWARLNFPQATVVIDHFHVVKLMNERVDRIRRRNVREIKDMIDLCQSKADRILIEKEAAKLKGTKHLLLYSKENLSEENYLRREELGLMYQEVGAAIVMRDMLQKIYRQSRRNVEARNSLISWCDECRQTRVPELISMAKTVTRFLDSIVAYWTSGGLNNGAHEGFNNKVRKLNAVAYGYKDQAYFWLRIFDLPKVRDYTDIC